MSKAEKSECRGLNMAESAAEDDCRPISSPYASMYIDVVLEDGTVLKVPDSVLRKCPEIHSRKGMWDSNVGLDVPETVGHVIIHHLFTGSYECLRPQGLASSERHCAEFETSVRVYAAARTYELPSLAEQAKLEMERLGAAMDLSRVIVVLNDMYPNPGHDDVWIKSFLQSRIKILFANPTSVRAVKGQDGPTNGTSIVETLLESIIEFLNNERVVLEQRSIGDAGPERDEAMLESATEPGPELEPGHTDDSLPPEVGSTSDGAILTPPEQYETEPVEAVLIERIEEGMVSNKDVFTMVEEHICPMEDDVVIEDEWEVPVGGKVTKKSKKDKKKDKKKKKGLYRVETDICESQVEHVFNQGWEECEACHEYVRQLAEKL